MRVGSLPEYGRVSDRKDGWQGWVGILMRAGWCVAMLLVTGILSCGPAAKEDKMGLTEVAVMTTVFATLAILRFGVPLAITWMVGKVAHHFEQAA